MGYRITWRSRPRSEYPWPLLVKEITNAQRDNGGHGNDLIGPLTLDAVTELIYRVNELTFSGTIATDDGTMSVSGTLEAYFPPTALWEVNELQTFAQGWIEGEDEYYDHERVRYFSSDGSTFTPLSDSPFRLDLPHADIYKDEDGHFWLHGFFGIRADGSTPDWFAIVQAGNPTGETTATVYLVLSGVTHTLAAYGIANEFNSFNSATITLTPSKWHAYKTNAGDPAWDIATGLPINGGPSK